MSSLLLVGKIFKNIKCRAVIVYKLKPLNPIVLMTQRPWRHQTSILDLEPFITTSHMPFGTVFLNNDVTL